MMPQTRGLSVRRAAAAPDNPFAITEGVMQKAGMIFAWCVLLANLVATCQWFIVTYQSFAVSPLATIIAIEYLIRVGWVLSGLSLAIGTAAWVRVHSARLFAVAVFSLFPYGVIIAAALAGIHPTA